MQNSAAARPSRRRLQRDQDFSGPRLSSFREVFLRHGLPGLVLGLICLAVPSLQILFADSLEGGATRPALYALAFVVILIGLNAYRWMLDRRWNLAQLGWILYLGALSFWEEWAFRLAGPQLLESVGVPVWGAAIISAIVFAAAHYFTLRWKARWCVSAFFGSLYFSYQMELHGDLLWVAGIHWIATLINTPRPPGSSSSGPAVPNE